MSMRIIYSRMMNIKTLPWY